MFPHEAVSKVIEKNYSKDLDIGFQVAERNKRRMHLVSHGQEEKRLSEKYRTDAELIKIAYPKTSKILMEISKSYLSDSQRERERAEYGI